MRSLPASGAKTRDMRQETCWAWPHGETFARQSLRSPGPHAQADPEPFCNGVPALPTCRGGGDSTRLEIAPVIQNTQTRDTAALQIKLDELIRTTADANNALLDLEEMSERDIERYHRVYERLAKASAEKGVPEPEATPPSKP